MHTGARIHGGLAPPQLLAAAETLVLPRVQCATARQLVLLHMHLAAAHQLMLAQMQMPGKPQRLQLL